MLSKENKYDFARSLIVGHSKDLEETAIKYAYSAVQRTFRFKGRNHKEAINIIHAQIKIFLNCIKALMEVMSFDNPAISLAPYDKKIQKIFDENFIRTCENIVDIFNEYGFDCYYGQAQKLVNITMKHLVLYGANYNRIIPYLHVPIDNVIYDLVKKNFNIVKPNVRWSRMSRSDYDTYQLQIRDAVEKQYGHSVSPFEWEWAVWNDNYKENNN